LSGAPGRPAGFALSVAHPGRGEREETMKTDDILLIQALASLIAAIAQLIRAMWGPP